VAAIAPLSRHPPRRRAGEASIRCLLVDYESVEAVERGLADESYLADHGLATAVYLAVAMQRPLLLEGEAGVGKTEVAKTLARMLEAELIRLQCYEGIDAAQALYEWDYAKQLLYARALQAGEVREHVSELYGPEFLVERPLLRALRAGPRAVLLIDEIDRADDEFEAFLLELLSDFQVSIPELGTISATTIPHVVLTSNGTRELSDALRRRCLYHYVDYPDVDREARIIMARIDGAGASLSLQIARMVESVRKEELRKVPGVAETLDWAAALVGIGVRDLHDAAETVHETLMCLLKTHEDKSRMTREVTERLLGKVA
jgi:MoxR-like ATPase